MAKRSSIALPCKAELPYFVLTDYDQYAEWLPLVKSSKLLAQEGDLAVAEFELKPPYKGKWVVECIHTRDQMVLWRTIGGEISIAQLQWDIEGGPSGQSQVSLTLEKKSMWRNFLPFSSGMPDTGKCLAALQRQISSFLPEVSEGEGGEKILDLVETSQGLVCWIRGKKYVMTPAPEGPRD